MDPYKAHGRRKAGTWGKPHKDLRTDANRATRALQRAEDREYEQSTLEANLEIKFRAARHRFINADPLDVAEYDAALDDLNSIRAQLKAARRGDREG